MKIKGNYGLFSRRPAFERGLRSRQGSRRWSWKLRPTGRLSRPQTRVQVLTVLPLVQVLLMQVRVRVLEALARTLVQLLVLALVALVLVPK